MPTPGSSASMQEQPVRIKVGGDVARTSSEGQPVEEEEYTGVWDAVDENLREVALKQLLDPTPPIFGDSPHDNTLGANLALERENVNERLYNIYSNFIVLFGLLLSSVAGNALSPLDASSFDVTDNNRRLANIYNLIAMVQLTIVLACCWQ